MVQLTDFLANQLEFEESPKRVISVVPSQTELLYDLGLYDRIIGITKFCVYPESKPDFVHRIGGTKTLHIDKILDLKPDLIIANKEENDPNQIRELSTFIPCYVSEIKTLEDNHQLIEDMGLIFNCKAISNNLIKKINDKRVNFRGGKHQKWSAVYFIWKKPLMVAGSDSFISHMMKEFGFKNLIQTTRYPEISAKELISLNPEIILLSDEPFPFKEIHIQFFKNIVPRSKVVLADGSYFSWYGSRVEKAYSYAINLREKINSLNKEDK